MYSSELEQNVPLTKKDVYAQKSWSDYLEKWRVLHSLSLIPMDRP